MPDELDLSTLLGFEWDAANRDKNWQRHQVHFKECEEVFFNKPLLVSFDPSHSQSEARYHVLGSTNVERRLFISFTIRSNKVRVISARDQSKKERKIYEKTT